MIDSTYLPVQADHRPVRRAEFLEVVLHAMGTHGLGSRLRHLGTWEARDGDGPWRRVKAGEVMEILVDYIDGLRVAEVFGSRSLDDVRYPLLLRSSTGYGLVSMLARMAAVREVGTRSLVEWLGRRPPQDAAGQGRRSGAHEDERAALPAWLGGRGGSKRRF